MSHFQITELRHFMAPGKPRHSESIYGPLWKKVPPRMVPWEDAPLGGRPPWVSGGWGARGHQRSFSFSSRTLWRDLHGLHWRRWFTSDSLAFSVTDQVDRRRGTMSFRVDPSVPVRENLNGAEHLANVAPPTLWGHLGGRFLPVPTFTNKGPWRSWVWKILILTR